MNDSNVPERFSLRGITRGLMLADHLGDVRDEIDFLHDLMGLPRPEGGYGEWTRADFARLGESDYNAEDDDA